MRPKYLVAILVLLALTLPASPAHAGGLVSICDQAHLLAALTGGGTVTFSCSGTITLTTGIEIATDTTIDGSGQTITISGNNAVRVFTLPSGVTLNLNKLTIADGNANYNYGGGIYTQQGTVIVRNSTFSGNSEGGIFNLWGTVTVSDSTFSGNSESGISNHGTLSVANSTFSGNSEGGIYNNGALTASNSTFTGNQGGGIHLSGGATATVLSSTFSGNWAENGGGIANYGGTVTVSNSTFAGNSTTGSGGGILQGAGTLTVVNSTFSGNSASEGGGICAQPGTVMLKNTIVANSPAGGNCAGTITDGGGNLSYPDTTCPGINSDPVLGTLRDNRGPTHTMALLSGSAALDAANDAVCAAPPVNNLDQRGYPRPSGAHCDIGAYELFQPTNYVYLPIIRR